MFGGLFKKTDYKQLLKDGAIIVDVREPYEYAGGCIPGSQNIPLGSLGGKINALKAKNVPVICVCASGMRSGAAKARLKSAGIDAHNGGGWTNMIPHVS